jgi:hypothetical protein
MSIGLVCVAGAAPVIAVGWKEQMPVVCCQHTAFDARRGELGLWWTAGMRKKRPFAEGLANGSNRPAGGLGEDEWA